MKKTISTISFILVTILAISQGKGPVITIEGGKIQGVETKTDGIFVYKGIPYAAPPTGALRWREPEPVIPWMGVRIMDRFGMQSVQNDRVPGQFYQKEFYWMGDGVRSEDCLFLNIWTPAPGQTDKRLPVAMFIHGGAYMSGSGGEIQMDGEAWAKRGVILVTINYRLGIFGFLAHPLLSQESQHKVSGNYGIFDQLYALKWIKNNISQFGGDPANITVFGQSAGAGSVQALVASPLARGLIRKAIIQSGGGISGLSGLMNVPTDLMSVEKNWKEILDKAGLTTLSRLRATSFPELMKAINPNSSGNQDKKIPLRLTPITDGYISTVSFTEAAKKAEIEDIPYMIGYTKNDIGNMKEGIEQFCLLREKTGKNPVYAYLFNRALPGDDSGAFHSSELWFMFNTLGRSWRPFTKADFDLSEEMVDCWTNFARDGDPNGKSGPEWKPYTKDSPFFRIFDIK